VFSVFKFVKLPTSPQTTWRIVRRAQVQRGDRGRTAEELRKTFSVHQFPQFDFAEVVAYCKARGINDGKWWHHAADQEYESIESFAQRAVEFKEWLGREVSSLRNSPLLGMRTKHKLAACLSSLLGVGSCRRWWVPVACD
jgi:hypothetical protein